MEDHLRHLRVVLELQKNHKLIVNLKKCAFRQDRIDYLGHIVSAGEVKADCKKFQATQDWPALKDLSELRGFLGLIGYYRHIVKGYGKIAESFTSLLKKDAFVWNEEAAEAFNRLKKARTMVPVLTLHDFLGEFVVQTDSSGLGVKFVLMRDDCPISFMSKALSVRNQSKLVYERELMAIVMAF
ncbi:uncharacterized mitochondrial protein AtMg00860-like [Mangifera indica]|uniref:uncharacterized mitochondrial protein AtMg00860-like n=1 Tax=Mangifera indica TaxID=29780 RepID=UPI001CFAC74F|nr:uncharacterized mitochondrial protein AtMg00860-like [Mangifera indica]